MLSMGQTTHRKFTTLSYDPYFKEVETEALIWLHIVSGRVGCDPGALNH